MTVAEACAELALLAPMLGPAVIRDATSTGTWAHSGFQSALSLYNIDVLQAKIMLQFQVPAAAMRCCELTREPWPKDGRTWHACVTAIPRWHRRMGALGLPGEQKYLADACRGWVRVTKRALGLWKPDIALGVACPRCADDSVLSELYVAGAEGFWRPGATPPVEWKHDPRIYCPAEVPEDEQPHRWSLAEWDHLGLIAQPLPGRLIGQPRAGQQQVSA